MHSESSTITPTTTLTDRTSQGTRDNITNNTGDRDGANDQRRPLSAAKRRRIKEQKIKQLMSIEELFEEDYSYPSYYVIKFPGVYIDSELNVIAADREIRQKVGVLKQMKKMDKSSILVQINHISQTEKILNLKMIDGKETIVEAHRTLNYSKGTVYSSAMSQSSEEELLEKLSEQGVVKIERMKKKTDGIQTNTHRYILTFNRTRLPSMIKLAEWHRELVDMYIPTPLRCINCQMLGHTKKWCRKTSETCAKCGIDGHKVSTCQNEAKCVNCSGNHFSSDRNCDHYKFRCEVVATQTRERLTYSEAMEKTRQSYREQNKTFSFISKRNNPLIQETRQSNEETAYTQSSTVQRAQERQNIATDNQRNDEPTTSTATEEGIQPTASVKQKNERQEKSILRNTIRKSDTLPSRPPAKTDNGENRSDKLNKPTRWDQKDRPDIGNLERKTTTKSCQDNTSITIKTAEMSLYDQASGCTTEFPDMDLEPTEASKNCDDFEESVRQRGLKRPPDPPSTVNQTKRPNPEKRDRESILKQNPFHDKFPTQKPKEIKTNKSEMPKNSDKRSFKL